MPARPFASLHALARRHARRADEADDLVQSAFLAALESGRTDLASPETQRWLNGVIRNRAAFDARTAARRNARDRRWAEDAQAPSSPAEGGGGGSRPLGRETEGARDGQTETGHALPPLSSALRLTALLALTGHTRREIGWLLNLSDDALRQRISQLRRALAACDPPGGGPGSEPALDGALAFGQIRLALYGQFRRKEAFLASHDPDGHLFVVSSTRPRS